MDVKYIDENGYTWLKRVKDNTKPEFYYRGITLGPPVLDLPIKDEDAKKLQAALVDARLVSAELLRGSSGKLYEIVKRVLPQHNTKFIVRYIKSRYQAIYKE